METLLQFVSSAWLGQSGMPSHSGLTLAMQEVELHWKFPLQFDAERSGGDMKQLWWSSCHSDARIHGCDVTR